MARVGWMAMVVAAWLPAAGVAAQQAQLYPEYVLDTDDGWSADAELAAFREAAAEASKALVLADTGRHLDPNAMVPFLADEVEIFVGQGTRGYRHEFVSLGPHAAATALEMIGRLSRKEEAEAIVQRRFGMRAIEAMLSDPTVGATPWLAGRICTASYGRFTWPEWVALASNLRLDRLEDWVIATTVGRDGADGIEAAPEGWPKRYQMVPVAPEQKRVGGWLGILDPGGDTVFFRAMRWEDDSSYFASYLNDHLCFERRAEGWKIVAAALRLE